jgi:hypothetical protein
MKVGLIKTGETLQNFEKNNKILNKYQVIQYFIQKNQNKHVDSNFDKLTQKLVQKFKKSKTILEQEEKNKQMDEFRLDYLGKTNSNNLGNFSNNSYIDRRLTNYLNFANLAKIRKTAKSSNEDPSLNSRNSYNKTNNTFKENSEIYNHTCTGDKVMLPELNLTVSDKSKDQLDRVVKVENKNSIFGLKSGLNKNKPNNLLINNINYYNTYNNSSINTSYDPQLKTEESPNKFKTHEGNKFFCRTNTNTNTNK